MSMLCGILCIFISAHVVFCDDLCGSSTFTITYCNDGHVCCHDDTSCCPEIFGGIFTVAEIVGVFIGGVVFIAIVITVICMIYESTKKRNVAPIQHTQISSVTYQGQPHNQVFLPGQVHQPYGYANSVYPPPVAPPSYTQPGPSPPQYNQPGSSSVLTPGQSGTNVPGTVPSDPPAQNGYYKVSVGNGVTSS